MNEMEFTTANLELQETIIERGLESFIEIGRALAKIREDRLYRQEYASFEVYCQTRWNLSRPRAYQLIGAATISDGMSATIEMSTNVDNAVLPSSEGQARELTGLDPAEAVEVMSTVIESTDGHPTAKAIREEVQRRREPETTPAPEPVANLPPTAPRRRALTEDVWDAVRDLQKAVRRLASTADDDRFAQKKPQIAQLASNDLGLIEKTISEYRDNLAD